MTHVGQENSLVSRVTCDVPRDEDNAALSSLATPDTQTSDQISPHTGQFNERFWKDLKYEMLSK